MLSGLNESAPSLLVQPTMVLSSSQRSLLSPESGSFLSVLSLKKKKTQKQKELWTIDCISDLTRKTSGGEASHFVLQPSIGLKEIITSYGLVNKTCCKMVVLCSSRSRTVLMHYSILHHCQVRCVVPKWDSI